jgi:hypothetical protein
MRITGIEPIAVPGEDAWRTTLIIELARQSSVEGRTLPVEFGDLRGWHLSVRQRNPGLKIDTWGTR